MEAGWLTYLLMCVCIETAKLCFLFCIDISVRYDSHHRWDGSHTHFKHQNRSFSVFYVYCYLISSICWFLLTPIQISNHNSLEIISSFCQFSAVTMYCAVSIWTIVSTRRYCCVNTDNSKGQVALAVIQRPRPSRHVPCNAMGISVAAAVESVVPCHPPFVPSNRTLKIWSTGATHRDKPSTVPVETITAGTMSTVEVTIASSPSSDVSVVVDSRVPTEVMADPLSTISRSLSTLSSTNSTNIAASASTLGSHVVGGMHRALCMHVDPVFISVVLYR